MPSQPNTEIKGPLRKSGAYLVLALLVAAGLALSTLNLAAPSLWHDELVHVYVGKHIAQTGFPELPGGAFYPSSLAYNYLLGAVIKVFGAGASAVRSPSALLAALNTVLLFLLARELFGTGCALLAALTWALSPWNIAWARQARLYELQALAYLGLLLCSWHALEGEKKLSSLYAALGALACFILGMLTSFHSLLALGAVGGYAILLALYHKTPKNRYGAAVLCCFIIGVLTLLILFLNPNRTDQAAMFQTGIGGRLLDPQRIVRLYYLRWLKDNHSLGYLLLVFLGSCWMLFKEGRRGLYTALAFFVPLFILTFGIGYRRPRFLFFAFPFYCLLFAYGLTALLRFVRAFFNKQERPFYLYALHGAFALLAALFLLRLGQSMIALTGDAIEYAHGSSTTLARHHPDWKKPCAWIKTNAPAEAVILTTTALPVLYYVGRVDEWFPNRYRPWEAQEIGLTGLDSLEALQAYVAAHPQGFFIAEQWRFERWRHREMLRDTLGREVTWVEESMQRIAEASSADVTVYAWGDAVHE